MFFIEKWTDWSGFVGATERNEEDRVPPNRTAMKSSVIYAACKDAFRPANRCAVG
jgi:hypothetical protein